MATGDDRLYCHSRETGVRGRLLAASAFFLVASMAAASILPVLPAAGEPAKALAPIPTKTVALMTAKGTSADAPLVIRTYKKEAELEIWKQARNGRFVYIETFPICRWSGRLGPKTTSDDRQTPEGFYTVGQRQMNPNSHYYLSFDTGYPNDFDRAHGASGSAIMVHGTCSSRGCFAMTDKAVGEIYAIARDALNGGQPAFQLQAYPFHMTAKNMALYRNDANIAFWRQLKEGSDRFEATGEILAASVADGRYAFAPSRDPGREKAAQAFHVAEQRRIADLVRNGSAAIQTTYADGGQNAIFAALLRQGADLGMVSRPEALAYAGIDVTLVPARKPRPPPRQRPEIAKADWAPEPARLVAKVMKVRLVPIPAHFASAAFEAKPMTYALFRPPHVRSLIVGAMPMRRQVMVN